MKITLFLGDQLLSFFLPNQVSGSYSFDENENVNYKLINVEAEDNQWVMYSNEYVHIVYDNIYQEKVVLEPNNFYIIEREEIYYAIYTSPSFDTGQYIYTYSDNVNLTIGNTPEASLAYECPFINGICAQIKKINGQLTLLANIDTLSYRNNERVNSSEVYLMPGDSINIYGLKLFILNKIIIINNPYNGIRVDSMLSGLVPFTANTDKYENIEVKEVDLYDKKDYFSKSPRIRRQIEEKEISIDKPPAQHEAEQMPLLLTIGPMLTMAASSCMNLINTLNRLSNSETNMKKSWPQLVTCIAMLISSLIWPKLTAIYNKHQELETKRKTIKLYTEYLQKKEEELKKEFISQKNILNENLLTTKDCLNIINTRKNNFWCKRVEQNDFLGVRAGIGSVPLQVKIQWPEDGFTIEEDNLKEMADKLIEQYKNIEDCPLEYSFYENFLTAIMGVEKKCYAFVNNMLLQLMTFYCYDELKIVVFTSEVNAYKWDYLKYSNYCFTNDKSVRFFASNLDEAKELGNYLGQELIYKVNAISGGGKLPPQKPHYLIICDNYTSYKKTEFFKVLTELDDQIGYSTIILENKLDRLPSKCINFINLNEGQSGILKNSYEKAEIINFRDEIDYNINMFEVTRILSNIPIEIEGGAAKLPESIEFLAMEKVGKVEQLNVLNRWNTNDSTKTLKAEVGVDEAENYIYLDLHEKFHGPHGLVAGTTGSGKSEFIITYILSMSINYSPDDVAFILIDYKGGGLAYAFENKLTGVKLPHLAGTITNLDKAEMNRTLVSIDSEVKRRQAEFNKARDLLGESTIDIYKYQGFYHEGKLEEPIPHLFIIADEFAELKAQQPEFMDNLISVARIGRSLGVHLILATQKPSGVVNDQIWSNTKFRVCLKVASAGDSNEMIKKPDAAMLKQSGRFYLQVGMDEIFELGQSGWAGAKYYPSDQIIKQVDRSVTFIDNNGQVIKNIQEGSQTNKKEAQGEQLAAVMKEIISVATQVNKKAKTLWLDNIPKVILNDNVEQKYNIVHTPFNVSAVLGEYDAPELQQQGPLIYDLLEHGNVALYGTDGAEREQVISALIYSASKHHTTEELNIYMIDYGSESLRIFSNIPHIGGIVYNGEGEKLTNLIKLLNKERNSRKKLFVDYGGDYVNYIKNSGKKLPVKLVIINNIDTIRESVGDFDTQIINLLRDSERYGIVYFITGNGGSSLTTKMKQGIKSNMALKLKDRYEYADVLETKVTSPPAETEGRGLYAWSGTPHDFQTASIVEDVSNLSKYIIDFVEQLKQTNPVPVQKIPTLPKNVRMEDIQNALSDLTKLPVGIGKTSLEPVIVNPIENLSLAIAANKINVTETFIKSMLQVFKAIKVGVILIDGTKALESEKGNVANYFNDKFDEVLKSLTDYVQGRIDKPESQGNAVIMIYGVDKFISKLTTPKDMEGLAKLLKKYEKIPIVLVDEGVKLKGYAFEAWMKQINLGGEGIWVGTGLGDQTLFKISGFNKAFSLPYPNNMAFHIIDGSAEIFKVVDLYSSDNDEDDEESTGSSGETQGEAPEEGESSE